MNTAMFDRGFNIFKKILYAKLFGERIPIRVALQLTKHCNMRCNYCYVNFDAYRNVRDRTKNELFDLIDELYSHGMRWLWFLGGEPMLREDFGEIIDYAKCKGIFCDMNSNGVLINERNINIVKKLDAVCISIDGDEESNDYYRGIGSYQKAIKAVKLLRRNNIKVRLHSVLTKRTYTKLDHMAKLSRELGVSFGFVEVLRNELDMREHLLNDDEERDFYRKYIEYKKKGFPILHSLLDMEYILKWPKKEYMVIYRDEVSKYPKHSYVPCLSGDLLCFLDVDGKVYACNGTWERGLNCYEVGFKKAWDYLKDRKCISCKCIGMIKLHLLFGFYPKALFDGFKNILALNK